MPDRDAPTAFDMTIDLAANIAEMNAQAWYARCHSVTDHMAAARRALFAEAESARLRARVAALEGALRPFAERWDSYPKMFRHVIDYGDTEPCPLCESQVNFEKAREVLNAK